MDKGKIRLLRRIEKGLPVEHKDSRTLLDLIAEGLLVVESEENEQGRVVDMTLTALGKAATINLTADMTLALTKATKNEGLGSWDFGSSTIGALKRHGLIVRDGDFPEARYRATESGRLKLAGGVR